MQKQIERVEKMEALFDAAQSAVNALDEALDAFDGVRDGLKTLDAYYQSADWKEDFEADEHGAFPEDLKRGVLSEDALYNLLSDAALLHKRRK